MLGNRPHFIRGFVFISHKQLISRDALANWTTNDLTGEPRASPIYTHLVGETMATVQAIYHQPGRQAHESIAAGLFAGSEVIDPRISL